MSATIHYHDIGDYLNREEKLKIIGDFGDIDGIEWQTLTPDKHGDWLNKRNSEFDDYIPLAPEKKFDYLSKSFFTTYSLGIATARDPWVYGFHKKSVQQNVVGMIEFYNSELERVNGDVKKVVYDTKRITWGEMLQGIAKGRMSSFRKDGMTVSMYRPFQKQNLYFDSDWNQRQYQMVKLFPAKECKNRVICVNGVGGNKTPSVLICDCIVDLNSQEAGAQCFPLYWYEEIKADSSVMELPGLEKQSGYIKHDAISDFILQEFRKIAGPRVQKEDIFNYVYGALHNPDYRAKFAADLKKQLPRLPLPKNRKEFEKVERIGRELANLHLHYEEIEPWPLDELAAGKIDYRVEKMAWAKDGKTVRKDMLVVNPLLTLAGIPKEAHEYVVNGRTPLEWLIERYQVSTHAESGIRNDPNKWGEEHGYPEYIVELVKRIVRLSVETVRLVGELGEGKRTTAEDATQAHPSATPPYWWKSGKWGVASPMPEGGHVVMGLKHKWYEKIEAGLKHEEQREVKPFWDAKLAGRKGKELRAVTFTKGQASKEQMTWEVLRIDLRGNYYCLELGKRIA